jgi:8-oxo-dGTP pyrophosphatase MutT (NUDIX family)
MTRSQDSAGRDSPRPARQAAERPSWIVEVRDRLASPPPRRLTGRPAGELRPAAVLVPLFVDAAELWTVLTQRAGTLPSHPSQIAFPGGAREAGEDPWTAALREAGEEIGLEPRRVVRLGELDEQEVPSGFRIVPCVGAIPHPYEMRPSEAEIAEVFSLPLALVRQPAAGRGAPGALRRRAPQPPRLSRRLPPDLGGDRPHPARPAGASRLGERRGKLSGATMLLP